MPPFAGNVMNGGVTLKGKSYRLRERGGEVAPADQAPSQRDSA